MVHVLKRITILNGIDDDSYSTFEDDLKNVMDKYKSKITFDSFTIRNMDIQYCCGCWGCWVKTPGKCIEKDDMPEILRSVINSDTTILLSNIKMGFTTSYTKKVTDKLLPLVHPYFAVVNGELHHMSRYDKYPKLGLILVDKNIKAMKGIDIITDIYKRSALNLQTSLDFTILSDGSTEAVENEFNNF